MKFFNKNELVLIILLILLLDLNGFCNVALNHIVYSKDKYTFIFLLSIALLLYDIYVFHTVANYRELPNVQFTVEEKYDDVTCKEDIESEISNNVTRINKLERIKQNCDKIDIQSVFIEKIVVNYTAVVLIILCIFAVLINNHDGMNNEQTKMIISVPIIIVAMGLLYYNNF